jgi:hypothetical protein
MSSNIEYLKRTRFPQWLSAKDLERSMMDVLGGSIGHITSSSFTYRMQGTDSLTWSDQACWIEARAVDRLIALQRRIYYTSHFELTEDEEESLVGKELSEKSRKYALLLQQFTGCSRTKFDFDRYIDRVEALANAYDQEVVTISREKIDKLYNENFREEMQRR